MNHEQNVSLFVPQAGDSDPIDKLNPPAGFEPLGELIPDLASAISKFVVMRAEDVLIVEAFILACFFPDCFDAVPYVWIVGPPGSAKTTLLKLLSCLCRNALLVGDVRSSAIYQLVDLPDPPTLLIDELDLSRSNDEMLRLLRTGTTRDIPAVRNGKPVSTFGFKAVSSRQIPADGALASRLIVISMLPTERDLPPLDRTAMRQLQEEFQPRLQSFRLAMRATVEGIQQRPWDLPNMTPRMRQIARVLASPFADDPERRDALVRILRDRDEANRLERSLEPEWQVAEALFALCHPIPSRPFVSKITVGGIAHAVNERLRLQGEQERHSARKVGSALRSVGLTTKRFGNLGRGLEFSQAVMRKIHEIARRLGIDRRLTTNDYAVDAGEGGLECALCEEIGVTGGLHFMSHAVAFPQRLRSKSGLLDKPDFLPR
jgi:hypothetical protein